MGNYPRLTSLQDRARSRVGLVLRDKWQLEALLGVGGTAAIYAARHRNGKRAAIKILHPELGSNDEVLTRFVREGYAANKLEHPGAVSVLDDDRTDDGAVFLVMELLEGVALDRYARQTGDRLSLEQVLRIGDELLDVLAAAHAKGVIHRDIKPANLFLTNDGKLKVLDFGIARLREGLATDSSSTQTGTSIGTPAFMPPEQARGRWSEVDARTDIWAAGASLFALLCGQRPRKAETVNEELLLAMTQPVPSLAQVAPHVPASIAAVIDRALAFDREQRWPDARAMQLALRQARTTTMRSSSVTSTSPFAATYDTQSNASPLASTQASTGSSPTSSPLAMTLGTTAPSSPLAMTYSPDTAPVLNGAQQMMPLDPLDARLTTSRPLVAQPSSAPKAPNHMAVAMAVFAATFVVGLAVGGFVWMKSRAATPTATATTATTTIATTVSTMPEVKTVSSAPSAATSESAPTLATTSSSTPHTTTSTPKIAPHNNGKPAQPSNDQDMMNQRF